jgi:uncharacterized FAD-dependent dehydrogenase
VAQRRFRFDNLTAPYDDPRPPRELLAARLALPARELLDVEILRKSLDARKKPHLLHVYSLAFTAEERLLPRGAAGISPHEDPLCPELPSLPVSGRPAVVGAGPAGQFAALGLVLQGHKPLILERGRAIAQRRLDVRRLWLQRELDPDSNVQFGEGGAGTFSDGKLTSRNANWFTREVLRWFCRLGAPEEVVSSHLPHVGTDGIRRVSSRLRAFLEEAGAEFRFSSRVDALQVRDGRLAGLRLGDGGTVETGTVVLAVGHSARDTAEALAAAGVALEAKPFAMGLRVEHPRGYVDRVQYGAGCRLDLTGAATYKLTAKARDGRGVYSFCMCPGGMVVLAASEEGRLVVNGMSWSARRMAWSNSALVVQVEPEDLLRWGRAWGLAAGPLLGHEVQRRLEEIAFREGGGAWNAPAQRVRDFLADRPARGLPAASYRPALAPSRLARWLPEPLGEALKESLLRFDRQMPGFADEGLLIAPETRTSSPLRVPRDPATRECLSLAGLFPVGEGAGYAGGIVSSAADGLRTGLGFRRPRAEAPDLNPALPGS